jgi:hypothetical protein
MKDIIITTILICSLLSGCSYSLFVNSFPHLKTVNVTPFENMTSEYTLAQDFTNYLVNRFQNDGRLKISTLSPDATIDGSVMDYRHEILSYDMAGNVSEYRVQILFSIIMSDLVFSQHMYENKTLLVSEVYSPSSQNPEQFTTEAEAVEKIFEKVFDTIIKATLESW